MTGTRAGDPAWRDRLISAGEVAARTWEWGVRLARRENGSFHLECAECGQSAGLLSQGEEMASWVVTTGELMSAVLRHMVMAHDQPLGSHDGR